MLSDPLEEGGLRSAHPQAPASCCRRRYSPRHARCPAPRLGGCLREQVREEGVSWGPVSPGGPSAWLRWRVTCQISWLPPATAPRPAQPNHDPQGSLGPGGAPQSGGSASLQPRPSQPGIKWAVLWLDPRVGGWCGGSGPQDLPTSREGGRAQGRCPSHPGVGGGTRGCPPSLPEPTPAGRLRPAGNLDWGAAEGPPHWPLAVQLSQGRVLGMAGEGERTRPAPEVPIPEGQSVGLSSEPGLTHSRDCSPRQGHLVRGRP